MNVTLMYNSSDKNVVSKNVSELASYNGTLRNPTSIMNPVISIEGSLPTTCNYMYIPDFGRYYFVTDIRSISNDIFEVSGHVDVLKTYDAQIRACSAIVARQQSQWNMYLDDGVFKTYQNPRFKTKNFPSGFSTMEFVFAVAGRS